MNQSTALMPRGGYDISPTQLTLIKRTIAKDCNDDEFNLFVEVCKQTGLNPIRRQIYCLIYNKDKPEKRQMAIITGIDGYRAIANRSGLYRPAGTEDMVWITDDSLKSELNPAGIVEARYTAYKWHEASKTWMECQGIARWDEYAPIEEEWAWTEDEQTGKRSRKPTGKRKLSGKWISMARTMIMKCAEAAALRRGWPEDLSGTYVEEEMDRARVIDATATEIVEAEEAERKERAIRGANSYAFIFELTTGIEFVEAGRVHDRVCAHIRSLADAALVEQWEEMNRNTLREFWARHKADALDIREQIEKRKAELKGAK